MEKVLFGATLGQVNAALDSMCDQANKGQRSRTAELNISPEQWAKKSGLLRAGGSGVANAYRGAASTTVIGVAWIVHNRKRIVRLYVGRDAAPHSSYGRREAMPFSFGTAITHWEKTSAIEVVRAGFHAEVLKELAPAVPMFGAAYEMVMPAGCAAVAADWLDENNHPTTTLRLWLALGVVAVS